MQNTISMQNEIWKDIKGYEGYYQISNLGRVKCLTRLVPTEGKKPMLRKEKIMKLQLGIFGYFYLILSINANKKHHKVHRLVAQAFIPNPDNKPTVNHINGIKTDNRAENLEWNTMKENNFHAYSNGLKNGITVLCTNTGIYYNSVRSAAIAYNINESTLRNYLKNSIKNKTSLVYA